MGLLDRKVADRAVGQIPISISTSLGVESLVNISEEVKHDRAPVLDTRVVMVNIRTLIRNIYGAVEGEVKKQLTPAVVLPVLQAEMQIIESTVNRYSEGMANVVFYACSHASLKRKFPNAIMRQVSTDIQLHYTHLERDVLKQLLAQPPAHDIRTFDVEIEGKYPDTMIITHFCVDLLSKPHFSKLLLLETHTGAIKNHLQWNTKLTKGNDLLRIPFCRFSLQVFGDNGYLFSPQGQLMKNTVLEMAEADKWTNVSTRERIVSSIQKVKDAKLRSSLLLLL